MQVLGTVVSARREAKHTLKHDLSVLESVETSEYHEMTVALRKEAGSSVQATQELKIIGEHLNTLGLTDHLYTVIGEMELRGVQHYSVQSGVPWQYVRCCFSPFFRDSNI